MIVGFAVVDPSIKALVAFVMTVLSPVIVKRSKHLPAGERAVHMDCHKRIDISSWQAGVDIGSALKKLDMLIVKATEGTGFTDKQRDGMSEGNPEGRRALRVLPLLSRSQHCRGGLLRDNLQGLLRQRSAHPGRRDQEVHQDGGAGFVDCKHAKAGV